MLRFSYHHFGLYILGALLISPLARVTAEETQALPVKEIHELTQVLELIKKNHVTAKSDRELLLAAINGMLASLDNQSRYLTSEELALFTRVATGSQQGKVTTQGKMISNNILYIDIDYFHTSTAEVVENIWRNQGEQAQNGMIIDLRDNPGGFVEPAIALADLFLQTGLIASSRGRVPEASRDYEATAKHLAIDVPIIILINEQTASAAEIVAAALQDYDRATLVGTKTYGKGSIQSLMNTKYGAIQLTTSYYYSPKGSIIHENGLQPDIVLDAKQQASVAEAAQIQYHQQSVKSSDWQLLWTIIALQQNKFDDVQ